MFKKKELMEELSHLEGRIRYYTAVCEMRRYDSDGAFTEDLRRRLNSEQSLLEGEDPTDSVKIGRFQRGVLEYKRLLDDFRESNAHLKRYEEAYRKKKQELDTIIEGQPHTTRQKLVPDSVVKQLEGKS